MSPKSPVAPVTRPNRVIGRVRSVPLVPFSLGLLPAVVMVPAVWFGKVFTMVSPPRSM